MLKKCVWQKVLSRAFENYFSFFRLMRKKMDWSRENILTTNTNLIGGCEVDRMVNSHTFNGTIGHKWQSLKSPHGTPKLCQ